MATVEMPTAHDSLSAVDVIASFPTEEDRRRVVAEYIVERLQEGPISLQDTEDGPADLFHLQLGLSAEHTDKESKETISVIALIQHAMRTLCKQGRIVERERVYMSADAALELDEEARRRAAIEWAKLSHKGRRPKKWRN